MSYNYLPLDRKWLNFQQVKNLLDYNQLVSITFGAHERILKCREYVDNNSPASDAGDTALLENNLLKSYACGVGEEVPADIVKLVLMLKIKSLSHGHSGIQIETVKRLMEMYNSEVLPVIYTQGAVSENGYTSALSHLSLPLIGLGEVYHKGQKKPSSAVMKELGWQPLSLQSGEALALITGTEFISAYGMLILKKAEQLKKFADVIAALSFAVLGIGIEPLHKKIHSTRGHKGQVDTAASILNYLTDGGSVESQKEHRETPSSFAAIPSVHGATKDSFDYVLNVFLKEINSVTSNPIIFPDEELELTGCNFNSQPLTIALDFLSIAMTGLANISERRICQLHNEQSSQRKIAGKSSASYPGFSALQYLAVAIISDHKQLSAPASINSISGSNHRYDAVSVGANAATVCLQLISNFEKILAIELMSATQVMEFKAETQSAPFLTQLVSDFRQHVSFADPEGTPSGDLAKAIVFISSYKL